jgi:phage tail-like protein
VSQPKQTGLSLRFDVSIDGVQVATFTGCSGLAAEYESFEWKEGGDNGTTVHLPGRLSYGTVKLTRAVDSDSGKLAAWFSQQRQQPARRMAVIQLYDGNGSTVTSWKLEGAWPVRYSGPMLATSAEGDAIAVETLELSHQGWLP